jgi:predicted dehydrogenase
MERQLPIIMDASESQTTAVNRRDFIAGSSMATVMAMLGGVRLMAQEGEGAGTPTHTGPRVKIGLIGLGTWGRDILSDLGRLPQAEVAAICDHYPAFLRRSGRKAPEAAKEADYRTILNNPDISAVIVATPTHQHREIAIAALEAGKHVYCEAPLANSIDDARAIALAARAVPGQVFQTGLQFRADPQRHFLLPFIRSGAIGRWVMARLQYFKKESWRRASTTPEREKEINWRLDENLSLGLVGEIGMHHLDQVSWFMDRRPVAVSGEGTIRLWNDGRTVADTVHAHLEFPEAVNAYFNASLATSFGGDSETYHGTDATILMRGSSAWMFKEVDSPLLGWEVYARKEQFQKDTGIVLKVGGSKQASFSEEEVKPESEKTALYHSLEAFVRNCSAVDVAHRDFVEVFGADDPDMLNEHLAEVKRVETAGYEEGYQAAVLAIKAAEAVSRGKRIVLEDEWFELS